MGRTSKLFGSYDKREKHSEKGRKKSLDDFCGMSSKEIKDISENTEIFEQEEDWE